MPPLDPDALGRTIVAAIKLAVAPLAQQNAHLVKQNAALEARLIALEARPVLQPRDGKDFDPAQLEAVCAPLRKTLEDLSREVADLVTGVEQVKVLAEARPRDGRDGKDFDPQLVEAACAPLTKRVQMLEAALAETHDRAMAHAEALTEVQRLASERPTNGRDGKDADPAVITAEVARAMATLPKPQDGRSVTLDDVQPLIVGEVQKQIAALPVPKDGVGLSGALIDRDGHLVVTLTDGTVADVGLVVGQDGGRGEKGEPGTDGVNGKDGIHGRDGTLENLKAVYDGERTVTLCFKNGDPIDGGVVRFPVVLDRGVWKAGVTYQPGDGVTWAGSWWIAQHETSDKPGDGATSWRLAVKRGNDGRPGPKGDPGDRGPKGEKGDPGPVRY